MNLRRAHKPEWIRHTEIEQNLRIDIIKFDISLSRFSFPSSYIRLFVAFNFQKNIKVG